MTWPALRAAKQLAPLRCRGYLLSEDQLQSHFQQFGTLLDVYLPKHKSGRNKGFGFTTFESELDLERALKVGSMACQFLQILIVTSAKLVS